MQSVLAMKEYKKRTFTVTIEKRQQFEVEVDAYDERGARGQLRNGGIVDSEKVMNGRAVGDTEFFITGVSTPSTPSTRYTRTKPTCPVCSGSGCHSCDPETHLG